MVFSLSGIAAGQKNAPLTPKYTNHLIHEKSPYLLLHAHNPVDWYPWGEEAFAKARRENKPIFLSVGYYTCHWCHVMERESYSNPQIAALVNRDFVAIKVDREERPDVAGVYIRFLESTTGAAGSAMTVFLTRVFRLPTARCVATTMQPMAALGEHRNFRALLHWNT